MKKTRMPQRLLSLVLVLMMLISVLPVSAMAAELTPSDPETGLTARSSRPMPRRRKPTA